MEDAGLDFEAVKEDPEQARHFVWTYLLFSLFRYPQAFGMILLLGIVAPRLISYDFRTRAYLLYLSRPLTPLEYVSGKAGVLYFLITAVATIPALAIYFFGLILSTNSWAIAQTWDIPLRIILATVLLVLPTSAIALALSSMTRESRYASFAWFSLWLVGQITYAALRAAHMFNQAQQGVGSIDQKQLSYGYMMYFSPYELLGYLQKKVFGLLPADTPTWEPFLFVAVITFIGYSIAYWRVARTLKT
jgi:ABC-type transport system involved in multi-copper enzyme maturation permease subunit